MASTFVLAFIVALAALLGCCHANEACANTRCTKSASPNPRLQEAELQRSCLIAIEEAKVSIKKGAKVARSIRNRNNTLAVDNACSTYNSSIGMLDHIAELVKMNLEERRKGDIVMTSLTVCFEVDMVTAGFEDGSVEGGLPAKLEIASTRIRGLMNRVDDLVNKLA